MGAHQPLDAVAADFDAFAAQPLDLLALLARGQIRAAVVIGARAAASSGGDQRILDFLQNSSVVTIDVGLEVDAAVDPRPG